MLPYTDSFQVGARNMQNFNLLRELGLARKPVLLKRRHLRTLEELLLSAEYIMAGGNYDIILCESRIRTYRPPRATTMDISAIPVLHKLSHLRVWPTPRNGTGRRDMVPPWPRPLWPRHGWGLLGGDSPQRRTRAASDAAQTLYLDQFEKLVGETAMIAGAVGAGACSWNGGKQA